MRQQSGSYGKGGRMSSYEKAKKSSKSKIVWARSKKAQKAVNRMGAEGPKKRGGK